MLYLSVIWHMHQPYYKDLETGELFLPWVRLHGTKDYLDMVQILEGFPKIKQVFNFVPSLIEQVIDYTQNHTSDKFLNLSRKNTADLSVEEKAFILHNFFSIDTERVVALIPRYYELLIKRNRSTGFTEADLRDLVVWFNLAWIDPVFRESTPKLRGLVNKGRFFSEEDKQAVLDAQLDILRRIIPAYKEFVGKGQVELTTTPYYHPILPLLYDTQIAKETTFKVRLPAKRFSFPEDARWQIESAVKYCKEIFGITPKGMWPSEQAVSEHIVPFLINAGINWIVCDEGILLKSLKRKRRTPELLYKPYCLKREEGTLNIVFRDRNLSDLLGFVYHRWETKTAVENLMSHLENIAKLFKDRDALITIAMDGENAWEYYRNDGRDFLSLFYSRLCEADWIKTETVSGYLSRNPAQDNLKRLSAGSWIYGDFNKWIGKPEKVRAWEILASARISLKEKFNQLSEEQRAKALRQIYIAEGSDWFWWYGDEQGFFDILFRKHLTNFYRIIKENPPEYLSRPL